MLLLLLLLLLSVSFYYVVTYADILTLIEQSAKV